MNSPPDLFYDDMASSYHLIFDDWERAIDRQGAVLTQLLLPPGETGEVLDCAYGIGTQALGLARAGYDIEGTDLSKLAIERASREAAARGLRIPFRVDDMRLLATCDARRYGAVIAFDNAMPHLDSDDDVAQALAAMHRSLKPGGRLLVSLRDYAKLMVERPSITPPAMFMDNGLRRIVHQVWDWHDDRRYTVHLYITQATSDGHWQSKHFIGRYRGITPDELAAHMRNARFEHVRVLSPDTTGYYQPVVVATAA
ncbi:MAG: Glycine/sarcosine N-methyltransferase [Burkholderia lata]|uniref:Glycine/sarcosine N-methyltransferase n=1 Tax=Burkholderia lata (strain ATCC 17760 / DSM 23089 / LMG 22485 / NCIMB 9086 / R18194 / 383) TaxID=482957 RepID=A0A833PVR2_BURL3|nr:class I SAM-dependent methyltransferase [Burkholderia lata]KAF1039114.1 MAG: Glycine/sarcosine N-methyltransferase [Burkholderia lata]